MLKLLEREAFPALCLTLLFVFSGEVWCCHLEAELLPKEVDRGDQVDQGWETWAEPA
jgi:hypothetical protein